MGNSCGTCCGDSSDALQMTLENLDGNDEALAQLFKPEMADILHEGVTVRLILQVSFSYLARGLSRRNVQGSYTYSKI